jgi:hypothetical protein
MADGTDEDGAHAARMDEHGERWKGQPPGARADCCAFLCLHFLSSLFCKGGSCKETGFP